MFFAVIDAKNSFFVYAIARKHHFQNKGKEKPRLCRARPPTVERGECESLNNLPKYQSIIIKYKTKFLSNTLSMVRSLLATCTHASKVLIHLHLHRSLHAYTLLCEWLQNSFIVFLKTFLRT